MAEIEKPNPSSFKLFKNRYKQKDNHPDYIGRMTDADGNEFEIVAWENPTRSGNNFFSGKITPMEEVNKYKKKKGDEPKKESKIDDLPF